MNTIFQLSRYARQALQDSYPEHEIQSICRIIYMDVFHLTNIDIHLRKNETLDETFVNKFLAIVERLKTGEPVQYIIGETPFDGGRYKVNPSTLIPRPETAELVAWAAFALRPGMRVLDIGTGTGCIAVSLARRCPGILAEGIDIDPRAVQTARENATLNGVEARFALRDILRPGECPPQEYDLIISNPPYIRESERGTMARNVLAFEPERALFVPDDDPLLFYRHIARFGQTHLRPGGHLFLEINETLAPETLALLHAEGYTDPELRHDFYGKPRMVHATRPASENFPEEVEGQRAKGHTSFF